MTLSEFIQEQSEVPGMVTNAVAAFMWVTADGQERVAMLKDGSGVTVYGILHLGVDYCREGVGLAYADDEEEN